jgi:hypothetical protein
LTGGRLLDPQSGWIEMIDDLGPTVHLASIDAPGLRERLKRRQVEVVEDPSAASTLVVDESSLAIVDTSEPSVNIVGLMANSRSPLRWVDDGFGSRSARLPEIRRRFEGGGRATRAFGVLRSTTSPLALVPFDSPASSDLVRSALSVHVGGHRKRLLEIVSRSGPLGRSVFPGWLVVAHGLGRDTGFDPTGQIGYGQSTGCTRVLGEPPRYIEREADQAALVHEALVLDELADSTLAAFVPVVIRAPDRYHQQPGRRAPSLVTTIMPGRALMPRDMSDLELETWTERAARLLDELQETSANSDGTVLVHGDYWLGNLLVDGEQIVSIIDWETAHRGSRSEDRYFLGRSLTEYLDRDAAFTGRIEAAVNRVFSP